MRTAYVASPLVFVLFGCNLVFGIEEATLGSDGEGGSGGSGAANGGGGSDQGGDGGTGNQGGAGGANGGGGMGGAPDGGGGMGGSGPTHCEQFCETVGSCGESCLDFNVDCADLDADQTCLIECLYDESCDTILDYATSFPIDPDDQACADACRPQECDPHAGNGTVGPDCGVFVDSNANATMADGTKDHPFTTVLAATAVVNAGRHVYVCGAETYVGSLRLTGGSNMYGGLDCATWEADPTQFPVVFGAPAEPALSIVGGGGASTVISHLAITGANGDSTRDPSSIAVLVSGQTGGLNVLFDTVQITSNNGADGKSANPPPAQAPTGPNGGSATVQCMSSGPLGGQQTCIYRGSAVDVSGGQGARCDVNNNAPGLPGQGPAGGQGGTIAGTTCVAAQPGGPGTTGSNAPGGVMNGTIHDAGYTVATPPQQAGEGSPGSGGGGGASRIGNTGGGGGAGGCGGVGGLGGEGGGATFSVVAVNASLSFQNSSLHAARAGKGGSGAAGQQAGGPGGFGNGMLPNGGCNGAIGGVGGSGGLGGGGAGGPAANIARLNTAILFDMATKNASSVSAGGAAGPGGTDPFGTTGNPGQPGAACFDMVFPTTGSPFCSP